MTRKKPHNTYYGILDLQHQCPQQSDSINPVKI